MPFKSKSQAKFMWANNPEIAREWASKTKNYKSLPVHKSDTPVWDKPDPTKSEKHLSQKKENKARARARAAGRPYPNLVDNMAVSKGLPRALKQAAEKDGLPEKILIAPIKSKSTREFSSKYPGTLGRIKAHYVGQAADKSSAEPGWRYDKRRSLAYAKAKSNKGQFESSFAGQRAEMYRQQRLSRMNVKKFDTPAWTRSEGKNPNGGLNAKGRASAKAQGHNLKPPVKAGNNPRRKSFLARMGNMPGPEHKPNGEPTRLLLSLQKWGASSKADAKRKAAAMSVNKSWEEVSKVFPQRAILTQGTRKIRVMVHYEHSPTHWGIIHPTEGQRVAHKDHITFIPNKKPKSPGPDLFGEPLRKSMEYSVVMNSVNKKYDGKDMSNMPTKDRIKNNTAIIAPAAGSIGLTGMSLNNHFKGITNFVDARDKRIEANVAALKGHNVASTALHDQADAARKTAEKFRKKGARQLLASVGVLTAGAANNIRIANKRGKLRQQYLQQNKSNVGKSMNNSRFGNASNVAKSLIEETHAVNRHAFKQGVKGGLIIGVPTTAGLTYGAIKGKKKLSEVRKASMGAGKIFEGAAQAAHRVAPVGHGSGDASAEMRRSIREHAERTMSGAQKRGKEIVLRPQPGALVDTRPAAPKPAKKGKDLVRLKREAKVVKPNQELLPMKQGVPTASVSAPRPIKLTRGPSAGAAPKVAPAAAASTAGHGAPGLAHFDEGVKTKSYVPHALAASAAGITGGVAITDPEKRKNWINGAKSQIHELTKADEYDTAGNLKQPPARISGNTAMGLTGAGTVALGARTLGRAGNLPYTAARNANFATNNLMQQQTLHANKVANTQAAQAKAAKARMPWTKAMANKNVDRALYHESRQDQRLIAQEAKTAESHALAHAVKPRMKIMRNGGLAMVAGGSLMTAGALVNAGKKREVPQ